MLAIVLLIEVLTIVSLLLSFLFSSLVFILFLSLISILSLSLIFILFLFIVLRVVKILKSNELLESDKKRRVICSSLTFNRILLISSSLKSISKRYYIVELAS